MAPCRTAGIWTLHVFSLTGNAESTIIQKEIPVEKFLSRKNIPAESHSDIQISIWSYCENKKVWIGNEAFWVHGNWQWRWRVQTTAFPACQVHVDAWRTYNFLLTEWPIPQARRQWFLSFSGWIDCRQFDSETFALWFHLFLLCGVFSVYFSHRSKKRVLLLWTHMQNHTQMHRVLRVRSCSRKSAVQPSIDFHTVRKKFRQVKKPSAFYPALGGNSHLRAFFWQEHETAIFLASVKTLANSHTNAIDFVCAIFQRKNWRSSMSWFSLTASVNTLIITGWIFFWQPEIQDQLEIQLIHWKITHTKQMAFEQHTTSVFTLARNLPEAARQIHASVKSPFHGKFFLSWWVDQSITSTRKLG